ncbi:TNFR/NGFR cysteine-rich region domain-containing protein [Ditylenchus destructor]|nr:TNFR/NGFR cysteine-rich region domain-containing protein [Ditylenchus destructor]
MAKSFFILAALFCAFAINLQALSFERNGKFNGLFRDPASSSSSSSSSEDTVETVDQRNWSDENEACPEDMFMKNKRCRPCSECGPDLYDRQKCTANSDTKCDWCLNPTPLKNRDFQLKCTDVIQLKREFQQLLEKRDEVFKDSMVKPLYAESQAVRLTWTVSPSWKLQMIIEASFYLALIALIFVVIRFISKSKPYYRTVTVDPPVLDESDNKNIIRAADHIRQKLGKKGYDRLEEFV